MLRTQPPRRPHEAKKLAEYFLSTNPYFKALADGDNGLPMEAFVQICAGMTLEEYDHGKIIFQEGDPSNDKFYVVYSGEVVVIVKSFDVITQMNLKALGEDGDGEATKNNSSSDSSSSSSSSTSEDESDKVRVTTVNRSP
jgi:hypothetical protein